MLETFTTYVTAQTITGELASAEGRRDAVEQLRQNHCARVVLEAYRGGCSVDEQTLRDMKAFFETEGFATLGGLMPVTGEGVGRRSIGIEARQDVFCYTSEESVAALEQEIRKLARIFPQIVIDDAFFTTCRGEECDRARNGRPWGVFRRDLLCRVAERWKTAAASERSDAIFTVKFPQYYDRYQLFGYDAVRFPELFDAVWQGTETRDPQTLDYGYVEPYQGYFNTLWMRACAGEKLESVWFDYLDCDDQQFYDQAVIAALTGVPHATVFCYHRELFASTKMRRVAEANALLRRLSAVAGCARGVHVIKPPNSDGGRDLFLFDYLGMMGIPCVPATRLDPSMRSAIVPAHATDDPDLGAQVQRNLLAGRRVITTFDALRRMRDSRPDLLTYFGYRPEGINAARGIVQTFQLEGVNVDVSGPVSVAGDLVPEDAAVLAWATLEPAAGSSIRVPYATAKSYASGGRALVWNIGTFGHDDFDIREQLNVPVKPVLLALPKGVIDFLRASATAALGFSIKAPSRVASFLFEHHAVFVNFEPAPAEIEVAGIQWRPETLVSDSVNSACAGRTLLLAPHSLGMLDVERVG